MTVNPFTFGSSVASIQLALRLETADRRTAKRISTHLHEFNGGLVALSSTDSKHKARLAKLWLDDFINHKLKIISPPDFNFDTTMKNVIYYRYRLWLEKEHILNKHQQADRTTKNARELIKANAWIKKNIP